MDAQDKLGKRGGTELVHRGWTILDTRIWN